MSNAELIARAMRFRADDPPAGNLIEELADALEAAEVKIAAIERVELWPELEDILRTPGATGGARGAGGRLVTAERESADHMLWLIEKFWAIQIEGDWVLIQGACIGSLATWKAIRAEFGA